MYIKRNGRTAALHLIRALALFSLPLAITCILSNNISKDQNNLYRSDSLEIGFSEFSPAYAAFEDEFLFAKKVEAIPLFAGQSDQAYLDHTEETQEPTPVIQAKVELKEDFIIRPQARAVENEDSEEFKGLAYLAAAQTLPSKKEEVAIKTPDFKLDIGPMVAAVSTNLPQARALNSIQGVKANNPGSVIEDSTLQENAKKTPTKNYLVSGPIELKEGLAFIGSMEVSWVIDNEEIRMGNINTPDGIYEISVNDLVGDIIVSLYDHKDELIGEGLANLDEIRSEKDLKSLKIDVLPIDWDKAGEVIHVHSLNSHTRPIKDAQVELYAYNDAAETNNQGEIRFFNWKKSNSRTLALASKDGFRDSIFLIDSKQLAKVILFENSYINAFFEWIQNIGIYDVEDRGTIYGAIVSGNRSLSDYSVSIQGHKPLYFNKAYFATNKQSLTGQNGLFAFVGLDDGDYELFIEKDGMIIDRRIVAVEQGKISPLFIDVKRKKKKLEFFDPLQIEVKTVDMSVQFFDGVDELNTGTEAHVERQVVGGSDPGLIDYADKSGHVANTFISRQRGFEKVAVLNQEYLLPIIKSKNFSEKNGLVIGYIQSDLAYKIRVEEEEAKDIVYFNARGEIIDPNEEPAYGFIIHGISSGLHTLAVESIDDNMLIMTDLVFTDYQSISVVNSSVGPL